MIIKKTSWHYKLIKFFDFRPSNSLCPYVRQLVLACLLVLFNIAVGIAISIVFVLQPIHVLLALAGLMVITPNALAIGLIGWAVWVLIGIFVGGHWLRKWNRERNKSKPETEPNIVMAYIKAKKEKICPTIDFE